MEQEKLTLLYEKMTEWFEGDPKRIQHFVKVNSFARQIGLSEGLSEKDQYILEAAALVHDIGIRPGEEKYGRNDGKIQEQEGPAAAEKMLSGLGFSQEEISRISYLVGHHHTYTDIQGMDYQILVEADFLVNFYEDETPADGIVTSLEKIFRTETGKKLCRTMFDVHPKVSETWAHDNIQEMEDFIESQGIYIRQ